ncbi:flagellar hook-length control protein FliK [Pseudomonas fontis]|uniref:Flagellar hook-length control protein FliK n=1 Tax=Pseudomonas fontis TaxID=2942633 RepID=A0ABT5NQM4_9PSED|nr:flagellar hook-length control protein FliK [Pseudomonas fontis]MDD0974600.1 flagellar hook-length control protein FliK [Pseudomonas fontis]MDD0990457.1 flagellar hook-length control protein FliK [Pseudomonas fontis]
MTGEINSLGPQAPLNAQLRSAAATGELLRLLQPQPGLLAPGESARAEVLSLRQIGQDFQMLLKLTQENGRQVTVQTNTTLPLPQGSQLTVIQPSPGNLSITLQQLARNNVATLTQLDTRQLPVGTLLQGKVITSQVLAQPPGQPLQYRSMVTLLNTLQAGATLSIDSPRPLALGSLLSAVVKGEQQLSFVPLTGRQDQLAISQNLGTQQSRQASLQGLLSSLKNLATDDSQPAQLRVTVDKLLASLPDIRQMGDAKRLALALSNSGAFLEAKLLGGGAAGLVPDLKAQVTRLVAQLLPNVPTFSPSVAGVVPQALPGLVRAAMGMLGQVSTRPSPGGFPLPSRLLQSMEGESDLQHLLRLAAAAISRLQSHQLASLEQTGTTADGNLQTTWQLEIPLRNGQDFMPLQVKVQREETPEQQSDPEREKRDPLEMLWRVELSFDLYPLGPLQVQAQVTQGSLSSQLWAELESTARLIESQLGELRTRLVERGLNVGELYCHQGTPPQGPQTKVEQRWVDENA